ncbi:MAG: hypothetical protein ACK5K7_06685 [Bacilli bacterium]
MKIVVNYMYDKVMIGIEGTATFDESEDLDKIIKEYKNQANANLKHAFETANKLCLSMEDYDKFDYVIDCKGFIDNDFDTLKSLISEFYDKKTTSKFDEVYVELDEFKLK